MEKFSLINVIKEHDGLVDGGWLQNHIGTLETAQEKARRTNEVNGNKLDIAIVAEVHTPVPGSCHHYNLKRLG